MKFYMDIISGCIAKMLLEDEGVIFDGVWYASEDEALNNDTSRIWMQCG